MVPSSWPAPETTAGRGLWLSPLSPLPANGTQVIAPFGFVFPSFQRCPGNQQKGGGGIQPHTTGSGPGIRPRVRRPSPGPSWVGLSLVTVQTTQTPPLTPQGPGLDAGWAAGVGVASAASTLAPAPLRQNRPPRTPAQPALPPPTFPARGGSRAQDWRIKFDLKEFYRSAQ